MQDDHFLTTLQDHARDVETLLGALLSSEALPGEVARPERLFAAMRHGVLAGGKRMRPALVIESARLFDGDRLAALRVAAALECVHCYSLIHDDLPAMDDDDLRRGQPTVHKAFDEAAAILAGDSLLTYAFDVLAAPETVLSATIKMDLVLRLARAAGPGGMAGGQALDLEAETKTLNGDEIRQLQAMKTGALIRFACEAGAVLSGAPTEDIDRLAHFGRVIGLAFQLRDDVLDLVSDSATLGKAAGKDAARGKGTLPALHGVDWTETTLKTLVEEAHAALSPYGARADMLKRLATYVATREK
ncbi:farnesyl diphosphate synthase [Rhizobium sp. SG_E_25_P2]|uniref:polyprenyl synthetase family protein n=1 Tax=Rhizobium sp. SG_E_25_P2 TaxID=2879942 RepID=UPI002473FAF7|nr:farnesyl diphosphate synthase [Rhizobium sp. SG_E_25_P2]MDH6267557.1 farnesyl diphosphate synthase [Rhizobium sp. SG_E_25_P2]